MKKILFCYNDMDLGGTEKALLSLISAIPKNDYEITIALISNKGILIEEVPSECKIIKLPLKESDVADLSRGGAVKNFKYYFKKGKIFRACSIGLRKIFNNSTAELKTRFDDIEKLDGVYDIAVAYSMHFPFAVKYVSRKVVAERKYVFIHNDFTTTKLNIKDIKQDLQNYDRIYAVSKILKNEFDHIFPSLNYKSEVFHNIVDKDKILKLGNEFYPNEFDRNKLNIVSVGRLNSQKGFDIAIAVAKKLKESSAEFCWYVIGAGSLESNLKEIINTDGLEDVFRLLGSKSNPYPYMKNCDIYVQPSRHEGYCTTTNEAKVFCKPIITTKVAGSDEQFVDGYNGVICDISVESIYKSIKDLIDDNVKRETFSDNLKNETYENDKNLHKFLKV